MRYSVILVPFPFDDLSGAKVRPAVCLTNALGTHRHVVLAFITSVVPEPLEPTDLLFEPESPLFSATGLRVRSALSLHRLITVSTSVIQRRLGMLSPELQRMAQERLRLVFGLA